MRLLPVISPLAFLYFRWLFPLSARETSPGNRSIFKSTLELQGLVWEMEAPSDGLLVFFYFFRCAGLLQSSQIQNFGEHFGYVRILVCLPFQSELAGRPAGSDSREFKKLQRLLQRKRHFKIELYLGLSVLRLFYVRNVVQSKRTVLSLAWHEWFSYKGRE